MGMYWEEYVLVSAGSMESRRGHLMSWSLKVA